MYLFQNDVFVKTTFIYLMGLFFPNATFIYFLRLLHSTFISTYITTPHLFFIYTTHLFTLDLTCKREGHGYFQTNAAAHYLSHYSKPKNVCVAADAGQGHQRSGVTSQQSTIHDACLAMLRLSSEASLIVNHPISAQPF